MTEILLIIALVIAIYLDIDRIRQYIQLRKSLDRNSKVDFKNHIDKLYNEWMEKDCLGTSFGEYCLEHWED